jgi:hypothetical protein
LKKFCINDYTKDKVVKIEFYKGSVQKIEIGNSIKYKNDTKRINNNVSDNNKYIFYIFSCYTDESYENMENAIKKILKKNISYNNKYTQIQTIKNNSVEDMKSKLPKNPNYLFSSDLMISADNIYNIYNKKIIILPCCHPITTLFGNKCNGAVLSLPHQSNLEKKQYINPEYYNSFYKGKGKCKNTDFLSNALSIISKESTKKNPTTKNNYIETGMLHSIFKI